MINRYYKEGQKLDVAGLNEITVLIDRSETELTEVGWNCWTPNQDGPPHKHDDKVQLFYVTGGVGKILLGKDLFDAQPGDLFYVPAGLVHQSITTTNEKLCYMLFNVFNDPNKEGHLTFADHIEKVKQTRKLQAETGSSGISNEIVNTDVSPGKSFANVLSVNKSELNTKHAVELIHREAKLNLELNLVRRAAGVKNEMEIHTEKEQTFYVIEGNGRVTVGNETEEIKPGNVIFIPRNKYHMAEAGNSDLYYFCLNGYPVL